MPDFQYLATLPEERLATHDVAVANMACAAGLPGGPTEAEIAECLKRLDEFANGSRSYTDRCRKQFARQPEVYRNSEGYFRVLCMVTHLWQKCGIYYNKEKSDENGPPLEDHDVFIHGPLLGKGGTCGSLPIVYAAVGRRLGYPIKLVGTKTPTSSHLFARWDDPNGERFNIDVNDTGLSSLPDEDYRKEPFFLPPDHEREGGFMRSKSPRHELAGFLATRGLQWRHHGNFRKSVEAFAWASSLMPDVPSYLNTLKQSMFEWNDDLKTRKPRGFPVLMLRADGRRYPAALPSEVEQNILGLEATDCLLRDPQHEENLWKPLRAGRSVRSPHEAAVHFAPSGECQIRFRFPQ